MKSGVPLSARSVTAVATVLGSVLAIACSSILGGCPGSKGREGCVIGTAGCACTQAGACDPGLSCRESQCVGPSGSLPPGEVTPTGSIELEPFRADGFTFAIPRGFVRKGGGPGSYVFGPGPGSVQDISRFQVTYLGRMLNSQAPAAFDLMDKALKDRKLTQVGRTQNGVDFLALTADSGTPGPERFVRIMYLRHWELGNEDVYSATAPRIRKLPDQVDVFTAEFAMADASAVERYNLAFVLRSIGWGLSIPADELTAEQVVGTWEARLGGLPLQYEDARGNWTGGQAEGTGFKLTFDAAGNYDLSSVFSVRCTGLSVCAIEGVVKANSRGRFRLNGGVLVLDRSSCELRTYDKNLQLTNKGDCPFDLVPVTLRAGRGENGFIRLSGLGSDVINAKDQKIWSAGRQPAGSWNVTDADRAAVPAPADAGGIAICGPVDEREPNPDTATANPIAPFDREASACLPTPRDSDYHQLTTPKGGAGGGWVELTISNDTHGMQVGLEMPSGKKLSPEETSPPGVPVVRRWAAAPEQRFILTVDQPVRPEEGLGWSKYKIKATYTEVKDENEPNETAAAAARVQLGVPVRGYFFDRYTEAGYELDADWFVFDLQPGPVSIKVDEIASDIYAYASLQDPDGGRVPDTQGLSVSSVGRPHTPALNGSATVAKAGAHRLEIKFYAREEAGFRESWKKPYRLIVSQP